MSEPSCWEPWTCPTCRKEWMFQWWNIEVPRGAQPQRIVELTCDACGTAGTLRVPVAAHGDVLDVARERAAATEIEAAQWHIPDPPGDPDR